MKTIIPTDSIEIGLADVAANDPFALLQHIRYLVKHEHVFAPAQEMLEAYLHEHGDFSGRAICEDFLMLLRCYRAALDEGSPRSADLKSAIEVFDPDLL